MTSARLPSLVGMAENEGLKMTNLTMTDHFSKHENTEHENDGPICET